jgi:hypothetical protein
VVVIAAVVVEVAVAATKGHLQLLIIVEDCAAGLREELGRFFVLWFVNR